MSRFLTSAAAALACVFAASCSTPYGIKPIVITFSSEDTCRVDGVEVPLERLRSHLLERQKDNQRLDMMPLDVTLPYWTDTQTDEDLSRRIRRAISGLGLGARSEWRKGHHPVIALALLLWKPVLVAVLAIIGYLVYKRKKAAASGS